MEQHFCCIDHHREFVRQLVEFDRKKVQEHIDCYGNLSDLHLSICLLSFNWKNTEELSKLKRINEKQHKLIKTYVERQRYLEIIDPTFKTLANLRITNISKTLSEKSFVPFACMNNTLLTCVPTTDDTSVVFSNLYGDIYFSICTKSDSVCMRMYLNSKLNYEITQFLFSLVEKN